MDRVSSVPAATLRLFPDDEPGVLDAPEHRAYLLGRILQAGDRSDLAWAIGRFGIDAVAAAVRSDGARRLDRRNRAFWQWVLGVDLPPGSAEVPWPLHGAPRR